MAPAQRETELATRAEPRKEGARVTVNPSAGDVDVENAGDDADDDPNVSKSSQKRKFLFLRLFTHHHYIQVPQLTSARVGAR